MVSTAEGVDRHHARQSSRLHSRHQAAPSRGAQACSRDREVPGMRRSPRPRSCLDCSSPDGEDITSRRCAKRAQEADPALHGLSSRTAGRICSSAGVHGERDGRCRRAIRPRWQSAWHRIATVEALYAVPPATSQMDVNANGEARRARALPEQAHAAPLPTLRLRPPRSFFFAPAPALRSVLRAGFRILDISARACLAEK